MSYDFKERNGTSMGNPSKNERMKGPSKKRIEGDKNFKNSFLGSALNGLPDSQANFPKNGRGPSWKKLKESNIGKGSI